MPRSDSLEWPIRSGQPRLGRCTLFAALFVAALLQADPSVVLGLVERDLTGDGKPEVLRLVGVGPIDNLAVTFAIEAAGKTIYRFDLAPLTRTVGFDAGRQVISTEAHRARIKEFGPWFFAEEKFQRPDEFVAWLGRAARLRLGDSGGHCARPPSVRHGGWKRNLAGDPEGSCHHLHLFARR